MKLNIYRLIILLAVVVLSGCKVMMPNLMLKTDKNFVFDEIPDSISPEYRISTNDFIEFRLFANDGFKLLDVVGGGSGATNMQQIRFAMSYKVEHDGLINLPIIGRVPVAGLTVREAEFFLEEKFSEYYNNPFAILNVDNRRVFIFPGTIGAARVLPLVHERMTLLEAIASVGGIGATGKAYKIKIIRGRDENQQVYLVDLRNIEGIKDANMVLQANDIIYIEPRIYFVREVLQEVAPVLSVTSTTIQLITTIYFFRALATR
jgi:polysaccharide biosynthesis/export protein